MGCGQSSEAFAQPQKEEGNKGIHIAGFYDEDYRRSEEQPAVYTRDEDISAAANDQNTHRLDYKNMYTIREISEHNAIQKYCDLFPWKRGVHSTAIFKADIRPDFLEMKDEIYYNEYGDFSENWATTPVGVLVKLGLKYIKIKKCLNNSKVAELRVYNDKEYSDDMCTDARVIENDLKNDVNITTYQTEYLEVLERFFHLLKENQGILPIHSKVPYGDPNLASFPLPDSVVENRDVLRQWIVDWVSFDTEVSYNNPWNSAWEYVQELSEPVIGELLSSDDMYRQDFYINSEVLNHDIEGEAAWEVISQDIVKNDTTTPEQDAIWEKRDKRTDLNDPERMLKRRQELAQYFITERADGLPTYCDDFMGFAETLEKSWKEFQELCEQ